MTRDPRPPGGRVDVLGLLASARPASLDEDPQAGTPAATFIDASPAAPRAPAPGGTPSGLPRRARPAVMGLAAAATAAAVAISVTTVLSPAARPARSAGTPGFSPSQSRPVGRLGVPTARSVLLTAAEHVASSPAKGRFWQVKQEQIEERAAGTAAHPYDVTIPSVTDMWLSPKAGRRDYYSSEQLGASPATPADAAAWRAAGAPRDWRAFGKLAFSTRPMGLEQTWQYGHGKLGYVEGNLSFWSLRRFQALPSTPGGLERALRREAMLTWSAQHPGGGGATVDQLIWDEAVALLQDPVSQPVRAAAFRVMAGLPGVRTLGRKSDPLGRSGYAIGTGHTALGEIAIVAPATGSLLAYTYPAPPASKVDGKLPLSQWRRSGRNPRSAPLWVGRPNATGPALTTCLLVVGWTNTAPGFARSARHYDALLGY